MPTSAVAAPKSRESCPHTSRTMSGLYKAMALAEKHVDEPLFLGDPGAVARYIGFMRRLNLTITGMIKDRLIAESDSSDTIVEKLVDRMFAYAKDHPDLVDGHRFAKRFFVRDRVAAVKALDTLRMTLD